MKNFLRVSAGVALVTCSMASANNNALGVVADQWGTFMRWTDDWLDKSGDAHRAREIPIARIVPRGAQPEIIMRRSSLDEFGNPRFLNGVSIDGQILKPGDTMQDAVNALGPNFRGKWEWDNLGITMTSFIPQSRMTDRRADHRDELIEAIHINLNKNPHPEALRQRPNRKLFSGYLELDGVGIDSSTTIRDIRALANRDDLRGSHGYIYCIKEYSECHVGQVPASSGIEVYFDVSDREDENIQIDTLHIIF
jgi:hypothetical protein